MFKNICIFGLGVAVGIGGSFLYFRKKRIEFEKQHEARVEKEVKDLQEARQRFLDSKKIEVNTAESNDGNVVVLDPKKFSKSGTHKTNYHGIVKPPLSSLVREIDDEFLNVDELDPATVIAADENMIVRRASMEEPDYEVISYDDPVPMDWDSDCLKYYIKNDVLTNDRDELFDNPDYILGPDVYDMVQKHEGVVYVMNRKMSMMFEVESIDEYYNMDIEDEPSGPISGKNRAVIKEEENNNYERFVKRTKMKKDDDN